MKPVLISRFLLFLLLMGFCLPATVHADDGKKPVPATSTDGNLVAEPTGLQGPPPPAELVSSGFTFSSSSGTYTPIVGGTVYGSTINDDELFPNIDIGFNFTYDAIGPFSKIAICANGYIIFNLTTGTTCATYTPISSTANNNLAAPFARDLESRTDGELRAQTQGTAPNRTFTIQWKNYQRWTTGTTDNGDIFNFQVILYETSNVVQFVYGTTTVNLNSTAQVGLKGASNTDYNNRMTTTATTGDWAASLAGSANTSAMGYTTAGLKPASGQTYTWTPPIVNTWVGNTTAWNTATNWNLGVVPLSNHNVVIPTAPVGGSFPTVSTAATAQVLTIQTGATLTLVAGAAFNLTSNLAVAGTLNATGGSFTFAGPGTQIISGAGSKTFFDLTLNNGVTFQPTTNFTVSGTATLNGILSHNAGSETYNGAVNVGATSITTFVGTGNQTYNGTVTIAAGGQWGTVTGAGTATLNAPLINNGTVLVASTGIVNFRSDYSGTGSFNHFGGTSTINLTGVVPQTVVGTPNFYHLINTNTAGINGAGSTWVILGNWTNNGLINAGTVIFANVTTLSGTGTSNFGQILTGGGGFAAGTHAINLSGNFKAFGNITGTNTLTMNGTTQAITRFIEGAPASTASLSPALAIPDNGCGVGYTTSVINIPTSTTITDLNVVVNISHTYNSDLQIYLIAPNGLSTELSTTNGSSGDNYSNTQFSDEAPTAIASLSGVATNNITGPYRPEGWLGFLDGLNTLGNWTLAVCDKFLSDTGTLNSWSLEINSAEVAAASNLPNITIASGSTTTTNGNLTTGTLTVNNGGTLNVDTNSLTATAVTNNGTLRQTQTVSGAADFTYLATGGYGGMILNANGGNLGSTEVMIEGNQACTALNEVVRRCFTITAANPGPHNATLTFFYGTGEINGSNCDLMEAYHWSTVWDAPLIRDNSYDTDGRLCVSSPNSIRVLGVTTFSPFALKSGLSPTAVTLQTIQAHATAVPAILLLAVGLLLLVLLIRPSHLK